MVTTRSAARAQAAVAAASEATPAIEHICESISLHNGRSAIDVDHEMMEDLVISPSLVESPDADHQIERIVGVFSEQTQSLASEHALLMAHQRLQDHAQRSALHAVKASTQSDLVKLAEHQHQREQEIGQALFETRAALFNEVQELVKYQDAQGNAMRLGIDNRLEEVLRTAQAEAREMAAQQSNETKRIELRLLEAINDSHDSMSDRLNDLRFECVHAATESVADRVRENWISMESEVSSQLRRMADEAITQRAATIDGKALFAQLAPRENVENAKLLDIEARIEQKMQLSLQLAQRESNEKLNTESRFRDEITRRDMTKLALETSEATEHRIERKMQETFAKTKNDIELQLQREAQTTMRLRETIRVLDKSMNERFQSLEGRVTELGARAASESPNLESLSRLDICEKCVEESEKNAKFQGRLESLESRVTSVNIASELFVRLEALERRNNQAKSGSDQRASLETIGDDECMDESGTKCTCELTNFEQSRTKQQEADSKLIPHIQDALDHATAEIKAIADRLACEENERMLRLEMALKGIPRIIGSGPTSVCCGDRLRSQRNKQQIIQHARKMVAKRAEAAALYFESQGRSRPDSSD